MHLQSPPIRVFALLWAALLLAYAPARAHEFWITPGRFVTEPESNIVVSLNVGVMMRGSELPYLSHNFDSFTVTSRSDVEELRGNQGDIPAAGYTPTRAGLHTITYHSAPNFVTFDEWQLFVDYLAYEGLADVAQSHLERGLPQTGFRERYLRHAKALVQVGPVRSEDRDEAAGAPLELVVLGNPYRADQRTIQVGLYRHGAAVPHHPVAVHRHAGYVTRDIVETDANGLLEIDTTAGGEFLLNATELRPVDEGEIVWESHWASLTFGLPVREAPAAHPLDPLTVSEIEQAVRLLVATGKTTRDTRLGLLAMEPPDKAEVIGWRKGRTFSRRAIALVRNGAEVSEVIIDLAAGSIERWTDVAGVQPALTSAEWATAQALVKADPRWLEAMGKRGYDDVTDIFCESLSAGYFGEPAEAERRLVRLPCYDVRGAKSNIYGRPIEGVIALVDVLSQEVLEVIDTGVVPVSTGNHDFAAAATATGTRSAGAAGSPPSPNFSRDGRQFEWRNWSFHLGFDPRFGPVVSQVAHSDGARRRSVLYEGHISEVFVPYMDGDPSWYFRTYMDAGEYGLGLLASPLAAGVDCPEDALFLDAVVATPLGDPDLRRNVICVFERDQGPLWRHWEPLHRSYEGRPGSELVVRFIPSLANYDYLVDWVFTQAGEIHVKVGATGIDAVKGTALTSMNEPGAEAATRTGALVAPNLIAVYHDHFFSVRLDLDVDGPVNAFVRERLERTTLPEGPPRRSAWRLARVPQPVEGGVSAGHGSEVWRFENPAATNRLGHRTSYQISGHGATSLLDPDDWPQRRAAFSAEQLWVTQQRNGERFASGPYPNQSGRAAGLTEYVNGAPIQDTDIVAWYTMGFHHVTRPEDWPVLPTMWHSLELRPFGFFDSNPAVERDE
jgi:primary-amine oxidase